MQESHIFAHPLLLLFYLLPSFFSHLESFLRETLSRVTGKALLYENQIRCFLSFFACRFCELRGKFAVSLKGGESFRETYMAN